jgi:hypothetical protein
MKKLFLFGLVSLQLTANAQWTNVPGPRLFDISVGSATKVLGTNHVSGFAWHIDPVSLNFVQADIQNSFSQVAIAADGTAWARVTNQGVGNPYNLYRALNFNGNYSTGWNQIAGALDKISCRSSTYLIGTVGAGLTASPNIYQHNGSAFSLLPGNGALAQVSVGNDGTLYGVYQAGGNNVYRHNGSTWAAIPASLDQISVGDEDRIVGRSSGNIYWFDNADNSLNSIAKPNGQNVIDIEVATDGTIYALTDEVTNNVYRTTWTAVTASGCQPITNMPTATRDAGQICAGQDVVYTLNHPLATYYTFTAENGWTGTLNGATLTLTPPTTPTNSYPEGHIAFTVQAHNDCSSGQVRSVFESVYVEIPALTISGPTEACLGGIASYPVVYTFGYWPVVRSAPAGWVQSNPPNGSFYTVGESGEVTATVDNGCFSRTESVNVTVLESTPAAPVFVSGTATLCKGVAELFEISVDATTTSSTFNFPMGTPWTAVIQNATSVLVTASGSQGGWLGPYTLTASASNVCGSTSATLDLTANAYTPDMGNYFEVNGDGDLQASYYAWVSYQWYLDGNPIAGATEQIYTPLVSGDYALETSLNGGFPCPSHLGASQYIEVTITGVDENGVRSLNIYPNPASLAFTMDGLTAGSTITLMDATGRTVSSTAVTAARMEVSVAALSTGIYMVQVMDGNNVRTARLVVN